MVYKAKRKIEVRLQIVLAFIVFISHWWKSITITTAQKAKFSIKDFFSKCDQIRSFPRIWSHLLRKSLMENFLFCALSKLKVGGLFEFLNHRFLTPFASFIFFLSNLLHFLSFSYSCKNSH